MTRFPEALAADTAPDDVRVLVVAGDPLARAGLASLLANARGCVVAGQADVGVTLQAELDASQPHVVLWDLGWQPEAGLERIADLRDSGAPPIVALLPDDTHAPAAWSAGARGLLHRDAPARAIVAAVRAVAQGLTVASDPAPPPALQRQRPAPPVKDLTPREMDVLRLLAEGLPNKSIAQRLGVTDHTVKFHVNAIMGKLGAQSRTEAVTLATRMGLVLL